MFRLTAVLLLLAACAAPAQDRSEGDSPNSPQRPDADPNDALVIVELSTVGIDLRSQAPVVLLRDGQSGMVLPIWVGLEEARAIARALHGYEMPRPMTHDLMAALLAEMDAVVEEVVVHELRDATYYGMVRLRMPGGVALKEVDSRPSDALALALRTNATIRVAREILQDAPDVDFLAPEGDDQIVQSLGITVVRPNRELRQEFGLPRRDGLVVLSARGQAELVGLRRGDLILEINGQVPREPMDFFDAIREMPAGHLIEIRYWREGEETTVELEAGAPDPRLRRGPPVIQT